MYILACERCGRIYMDSTYCHPWNCGKCEDLPPADLKPAGRTEPIETKAAEESAPKTDDLGPLFA